MEIGYYPGCALHGSSNDYETSVRACLSALDVGLKELDDWLCCGASAAHSLNHKLSVALPARNLALAERDGMAELLAPCPMCSGALLRAKAALHGDARLREEMGEIIELPVAGSAEVLNLVQIFERAGIERIRERAVRTLEDYRPACYYGCLLTRPPQTTRFDDCEQPRSMESLLSALGAEPVDWAFRTECCGAGMTVAREETVLELAHRILSDAAARGANCLVVACPMCHVNLDMKQADVARRFAVNHRMIVYYLSDLVGLALGLSPEALGVDRHFVVR